MKTLGQGHCTVEYLAGWDGKGIDSQEACNKVCETENDCTFAAFKKDASCSRYKGKSCKLQYHADYFTFQKRTGKDGGIIKYKICNIIQILKSNIKYATDKNIEPLFT